MSGRESLFSGVRVRPIFAWYDAWIGVFWDGARRRLYIFPVPCVGLRIDFGGKP